MSYIATIDVEVEANDEGEALDRARDVAEDADMNEYVLTTEREAQVLAVE